MIVTPTTAPPGGNLPRTGSDTGKLVLLGVGLLLAGVLLVLSTHRAGLEPALAMPPVPPTGPQKGTSSSSIFESWKRTHFGQ